MPSLSSLTWRSRLSLERGNRSLSSLSEGLPISLGPSPLSRVFSGCQKKKENGQGSLFEEKEVSSYSITLIEGIERERKGIVLMGRDGRD